jgi:hypothetical protein
MTNKKVKISFIYTGARPIIAALKQDLLRAPNEHRLPSC